MAVVRFSSLFLLVVGTVLVTGCAATRPQWTHPVNSESEFYADRAECTRAAREMRSESDGYQPDNAAGAIGYNLGAMLGKAFGGKTPEEQNYYDCMRGRGYRTQ